MSLANVIAGRRDAVIKAWVNKALVQVQAESTDVLPRLVFIDTPDNTAEVGALGRRNLKNAAVVQQDGDPDTNASLWVRSQYSSYRAAYVAFVNTVYGLNASNADLAGFDIDHLLNRARAPKNSTFVRIEAVPSGANQAWGRLFEKAASDPRFFANQERERRTMSWVICAKLAGKMPPYGPDDKSGINQLVNFFRPIGLDAVEAREGLESMLEFAYKFR